MADGTQAPVALGAVAPPGSSNWSTPSGVMPVTGVDIGNSALSGPWFIESQACKVTYTRVPQGSLSAVDVSLSSVQSVYRIEGSKLCATVQAVYYRTSAEGHYSTSSYKQLQKFQIYALSTDAGGHAYNLSAGHGAGAHLGPRGSVNTVQPYWYRRPLMAADTSALQQCFGTDYVFGASGVGTSNNFRFDPRKFVGNYKHSIIDPWEAGTFLRGVDVPHAFNEVHLGPVWDMSFDNYHLYGPYDPRHETIHGFTNWMDNIGWNIKGRGKQLSGLFSIPPKLDPLGPIPSETCSDYDPHRHDYR